MALAFLILGCASEAKTGSSLSVRPEPGAVEPALRARSPKDRKLVQTMWFGFAYDSDEEKAAIAHRARRLLAKVEGFVQSEHTMGLVLRVPAESLDGFVEGLEGIGEIVDRGVRTDEVTAEHFDLNVRIENARRLKDRLLELLAKAEKVEEMLAVEKELARVTEELERLEGQMRLLNDRIDYASVELHFEKRVNPGPVGWVFYGLYRGIKWLFVWD